MQTVQLSIADGPYAAAVREALSRSCAWHVETVDSPDPSQQCVLVLDELAFARLPLPLSNPERIVLIAREESPSPGPGVGSRHRFRGFRGRSPQHRPARHHGGGPARCKNPRTQPIRAKYPPLQLRICANSPTKRSIPAKTLQNSIVSRRSAMVFCVHCLPLRKGECDMDRSLVELESIVRNRICKVCTRSYRGLASAGSRSPPVARCSAFFRKWRRPSSR